MQSARLEHLNITVLDPDATARQLVEIFDWTIRWSGDAIHGGHSVHVGAADSYLALFTVGDPRPLEGDSYHSDQAVNHIGIEVDDLDAAEARVLGAGLETYSHQDYEPGRRFYFRVGESLEFEVLSYS